MIKELLIVMNIFVLPDVVLHENVLQIARDLRTVYSGRIVITSNFRTQKKNREAGGCSDSRHLCGKAIDIRIWGLDKNKIDLIMSLMDSSGYDVIRKRNHIHIEMKERCNG